MGIKGTTKLQNDDFLLIVSSIRSNCLTGDPVGTDIPVHKVSKKSWTDEISQKLNISKRNVSYKKVVEF